MQELSPAAPGQAGFDAAALAEAVAFVEAAESDWPRSLFMPSGEFALAAFLQEAPPHSRLLGPVTPRGGPSGMILRGGRVAARWGDAARPDMTFSIAKSYLGVLAGIALDRGLIPDLDARVAETVPDDGYESAQNAPITWRHLLQLTSEWEGTLWDKSDAIDRNRQAGATAVQGGKGTARSLGRPGSHWEYNDVRVNRLSLSLLRAFREPLPAVLKREVMDPIGASATWRWDGYDNATVTIDGRPMVSVPGGGHWGGGIVISAEDHARFGLLVAQDGMWAGRRVLPAGWCGALRASPPQNPAYGLLWWLNVGHAQFPSAPERSLLALGAGMHVIWIDPDHDLVVVLRWIDKPRIDGAMQRILAALR